jgi:hypothetical protein
LTVTSDYDFNGRRVIVNLVGNCGKSKIQLFKQEPRTVRVGWGTVWRDDVVGTLISFSIPMKEEAANPFLVNTSSASAVARVRISSFRDVQLRHSPGMGEFMKTGEVPHAQYIVVRVDGFRVTDPSGRIVKVTGSYQSDLATELPSPGL